MASAMIYPWSAVAYTQSDFHGDAVYFEADYQTKNEVIKAASDHDKLIGDEGMVLLKNDGALPLDKITQSLHFIGSSFSNATSAASDNVTNCPEASYGDVYDIVYGGGGSSNVVRNDNVDSVYTLERALTEEGFGYSFIDDSVVEAGTAPTDSNAVAVIVIARYGTENSDYSRSRTGDSGHDLRINEEDVDRLMYAAANYEDVIILFNTGTQFEAGFIQDPEAYFDATTGVMPMGTGFCDKMTTTDIQNIKDHVTAGIVIAYPGNSALVGLGNILSGDTNPSGRLTATWYNDFTLDPSFQNFGSYTAGIGDGGYYVYYQESIYVGYRYYETRGYEESQKDADSTWYEDNAGYPMGYGISYSTFSYEVLSTTLSASGVVGKYDDIKIEVKVTNTGDVAGKEVVQAYGSAPHYDGIEKSKVVMVDFQKTDIIQPGEYDIVTMSFNVEDMKNYDNLDANRNGFKGYELEAGEYNIYISQNSHSWADNDSDLTVTYTVPENSTSDLVTMAATNGKNGYIYDTDTVTGYKVENIFDDITESLYGDGAYDGTGKTGWTYMSRNDFTGTFPIAGGDTRIKNISEQTRQYISTDDYNNPDMPWYVPEDQMPTYAETTAAAGSNEIQIYHMMGRTADDPLWDELLDQLSIEEMASITSDGFQQIDALTSIGLPRSYMNDGPLGWNSSGTGTYDADNAFKYSGFTLDAQTYNRELCYERGRLQGSEGALGNIELATNGGNYFTYSGLWSPGMNIARSPFCGRNFEYFGEDPFLNGELASEVIDGLTDMGVRTHMKHFFMNEQETRRMNVSLYANEQAMREIYARGYEKAIKEGGTSGIMTSFSRVGRINSSEVYAQNQTLARDEWGFDGMIMTDWKDGSYGSAMLRAGTDIPLDSSSTLYYNNLMGESMTATHVTAMRNSTRHILYALANSNAMNGLSGAALASEATAGKDAYMLVDSEVTIDISYIASNRSGTEYTYSVTGGDALPSGLEIVDGEIVGSPTESGEFNVQVTANETDLMPSGNALLFIPYSPVTTTVKLTVFAEAPDYLIYNSFTLGTTVKVNNDNKLDVATAAYYTDSFQYDGVNYALAEGSSLVGGLTLSSDGYIEGNPSEEYQGTYTVDIVASCEGYTNATATVTYTIMFVETTYENIYDDEYFARVGEDFYLDVASATTTSDGVLVYELSGDSLPGGIALNGNTGIISGTPTRGYEDLEITITAKASGAEDVSITFLLTVCGIAQDDLVLEYQVYREFYYDLSTSAHIIEAYDGSAELYYAVSGTEVDGITLTTSGKIVGMIDGVGDVDFKILISAYGYADVEIMVTITIYEYEY